MTDPSMPVPTEADVAKMVERLRDNGYAPAGNAMPLRNQAADMLMRLSRPSAAGVEVLAEREACAKIADELRDDGLNIDLQSEPILWIGGYEHGCRDVAIAIRARHAPPVAAGEEG